MVTRQLANMAKEIRLSKEELTVSPSLCKLWECQGLAGVAPGMREPQQVSWELLLKGWFKINFDSYV